MGSVGRRQFLSAATVGLLGTTTGCIGRLKRYTTTEIDRFDVAIPGTATRTYELDAGERIAIQAPKRAGRVGLFHEETGTEVLSTAVDSGALAPLGDGRVESAKAYQPMEFSRAFSVGVPESGTYRLLCVYGPQRIAKTFTGEHGEPPQERSSTVTVRSQGGTGSYSEGALLPEAPIETELQYLERLVDPELAPTEAGFEATDESPQTSFPHGDFGISGVADRGLKKYMWQRRLHHADQFYPTFDYLRRKNAAIQNGLAGSELESRVRTIKSRLFFQLFADVIRWEYREEFRALRDVTISACADKVLQIAGISGSNQQAVVREATRKRFDDELHGGFDVEALQMETHFQDGKRTVVEARPVIWIAKELSYDDEDVDFVEDELAANILMNADAPQRYDFELLVPAHAVIEFWPTEHQLSYALTDVELEPDEARFAEVKTGDAV
jgi:hypothetical protein